MLCNLAIVESEELFPNVSGEQEVSNFPKYIVF